jgi:hypothetical protein
VSRIRKVAARNLKGQENDVEKGVETQVAALRQQVNDWVNPFSSPRS